MYATFYAFDFIPCPAPERFQPLSACMYILNLKIGVSKILNTPKLQRRLGYSSSSGMIWIALGLASPTEKKTGINQLLSLLAWYV